MSVDAAGLGDVAALATALGLLDNGSIQPDWFADPGRYVSAMLRDAGQRTALAQFVEDAFSDHAAAVTDDPGRTWVPLAELAAGVNLYAVLEAGPRGEVVSAGVRISMTDPAAEASVLVPLVRVNQGSGVTFLPGLSSADAGDITDATAALTAAVTLSDGTLNSVGVSAAVPLTQAPGGGLSGTPAVGVTVRGLRLPGGTQPLDISLDSASPLGPELASLLTAVLRAEAAGATGAARDLLGMAGLLPPGGPGAGAIPPLPVADILTRGFPALREWLLALVGSQAAMAAWIGLLGDLTGAAAVPGGPPFGVRLASGRTVIDLTVDVAAGPDGDVVIMPGAAVSVQADGGALAEVSVGADVTLARIQLGARPGVQALPLLRLSARYGGDSGTIAAVSSPLVVNVGALRTGIALDNGRQPVFVLAAERVDVGLAAAQGDVGAATPRVHHHDVLDLTSPDALADVGSEALDAVVAEMLGALGQAGDSVSVLIGLTPPASHATDEAWPKLSAGHFVADPAGALAAFWRSVADLGASGFADLLSAVPGLLGISGTGSGAATAAQPWTLDLATGAALSVWQDGPAVHAGVRLAPPIPPLGGTGGPVLGVAVTADGLAVTLPIATGGAGSVPTMVTALPGLQLEVTLTPAGGGLTFGAGYEMTIPGVRLVLAWKPGSGLTVSFDLPGATDGGSPLPPVTLGPGGQLSLPASLPWDLVEQVAGAALEAAPEWARGLPGLLGLDSGAFDMAGGLGGLVGDPLRFLGTLLGTLLASEADAALAALAGTLAALAGGVAGAGVSAGSVTGSGTPDAPYAAAFTAADSTRASVTSATSAAEAVLWLAPDGPAGAGGGAVAGTAGPALEALGRWLDGDPDAAALPFDQVAALLGEAATGPGGISGLSALLAGRPTDGSAPDGPPGGVAAGLAALQARLAGGDGLLPGGSTDVPGATAVPLAGVSYGNLPGAVDLAAVLGAAPDMAAVVYVSGPFEPPWPGTDAVTFDLTQPGLAATAFDLSRATAQDGPWHARLAPRAACQPPGSPVTGADAQLQAQAARLARVVDVVAERRPAGVVLVAHGSAGQAARLVASHSGNVAALVLLGVPADGLPLDVLDVPPAADILQFLRHLLPAPDPGLPDDESLALGRSVLGTLGGVLDSPVAPASEFLPPQAPGSLTPPSWSVRGVIDADSATRALSAVIRAGLYAVAEPAQDSASSMAGTSSDSRPPEAIAAPASELRGGVRVRASYPPATAGPGPAGVAVDVAATISARLVALAGMGAASGGPPEAELVITLSRPGGWLAGGPQGVAAAPDVSRTPALRRAELRVSTGLTVAGPQVRARITLDEVNALGLVADRLVLGDGGGPVLPEARILLGRLASTLGPAPAGSALDGVVRLLSAAGLTDPSAAPPAVGLSADAVTRLSVDPAGQLRAALGDAAARADTAAALRLLAGDSTSTGSHAAFTVGGVTLAVDLTAPVAVLRVSAPAGGLALAGGLTIDADMTVDASGAASGSASLAPSGPPGPAGRPELRISAGEGSGTVVGLHIDGGLAGLPSDLSLWPLPSGASVAGALPLAAALFAGMLARDLLTALRDLDPGRLDPVLDFLGLLDTSATAGGAPQPPAVRLPAGLIADPGGWLGRTLGGQELDPDRIASLVDAVREFCGLPSAAHGTMPLPLGATLTAGPAAAGGLRVTVAAAGDAGPLHLDGIVGLTVAASAVPVPVFAVAAGPAGSSAAMKVGLSGSALTVAIELGNGNVIPLYPSGPGLGSLASAAVTAALPLVLSQLEAHAPDPVPAALTAARTVLGLGAATWDAGQLKQLAADPAGELRRRLAAGEPAALGRLIAVVQPALPSGWAVDTSDPQAVTVTIGAAPVQQRLTFRYAVSPPAFSADIVAGLALDVSGVALTGTAAVTVDGSGLRLADMTIGVDPARPAALGPVALAPFARFAAGADAPGGARGQAGLAVSAGGHAHALTMTVTAGPPLAAAVGTATDGQPDAVPDIAAIVTGLVIPALADVALADPGVAALLALTALPGMTVGQLLDGVLLKAAGPPAGWSFDPGALDPALDNALGRLLRLAGNVAAAAPGVTVGDHLRVEVAQATSGTTTSYGIGITVDPGERVPLTEGDLVLALEVDSSWTDVLPGASPGLSVLLLDHDDGHGYHLATAPSVLVNGVGLRLMRDDAPLLDSVPRIDSVALYGLASVGKDGIRAVGGRLELAGLGIAPAGAAGGDNAVAQGMLGDASSGGQAGDGDATPLAPQFSPSLALEKPAGGSARWSLRAGDENGPWWVVIQRSFGPLHVEQVGFGVDQDGTAVHGVRVLFDGGLSLLGLTIDVEELSVGATWPVPGPPGAGPALTDPQAWSLDLAGLAVGYSGGSVSLAGALRKRGSPPDYTGVLIAHLGPYELTAFGGYGQFAAPDGGKYTSLFVVAGITAPIGGPPAFFVTGLGGGAGVNRRLILPATLDDFPSYPLIAALDPHSTLASDPQHALDQLSASFPPERGTFWFAAGVSFTSFVVVEVTAVVAASVGDGFQLALLGLGRLALPNSSAPLAEIELAMQARFSTKEGALVVAGQLTQNSWLLAPDCRLTGGFAFASFFGPNPNAGQVVATVGGYYPDFRHDGYPVVPRVGYVWAVASVLTISGQSYFAVTSDAIMAGTSFTASLDLGFLWASLTLGVDAIVYYDPFSFDATGYAAITAGVSMSIDLGWFGTITVNLSFHLSAQVTVHGPDFSGTASIDLDVTSATIAFGSGADNATHELSWAGFSAKYLTSGGTSALSAMPQAGQVTGTATTPAGTTPTGEAAKPWKLTAEWSLSVATTAAATALQLPGRLLAYDLSEVPGIASMGVHALTSTLAVTVTANGTSQAVLGPGDPHEGLRVALVTAPLPKAVWTANPDDAAVPSGDTLTAGTGFTLIAEAIVEGASPPIAASQVTPGKERKPLPFAQETAARPQRQPDDGNAAAFAAAAAAATADPVKVALGYLTSGPLSVPLPPLGEAAFGRDRVAPPRPALLTEGMVAPPTPAPATVPVTPAPPPVTDTSVHPPVLAALLGGGPVPGQRHVPRMSAAAAIARAAPASPSALPEAAAPVVPRFPAPTLAQVTALTDPALAAALTRRAPAAIIAGPGLRAADGGPVSLRAGTPAESRSGPAATAAAQAVLAGTAAALLRDGAVLRPGDALVAELPNVRHDLDGGQVRPSVTVAGDAAVRVVALSRTGQVLADATGTALTVPVPQHTARVALWCVGGDGSRPAGLAGWTDVSRLPQPAARALLAADAVVTGVPRARRGMAAVSTATVPAAAAAAAAKFVTTRLPSDTAVVVVCADQDGGDSGLAGLTLGLAGAIRRPAPGSQDGGAAPPVLVAAGDRAYLLYDVVPTVKDPAVEVSVGTSAGWRLAGVLGGPGDAATTAAQLAAHGAAALAAPLLRAPTGSATVTWHSQPEVS